ncbi:hypothetical protein CYMTET_5454 [Cymbomonas tetramitiformis]|uniref:Uncharacterized protein n=1 Tax=Cymbomonas tetramitiformis TaxID=36881 RepID=A0AAE0H115_9CHLO|nr:hypothetical protein CYMTET_5454 [Cymbomonas tetramitiformis]
MASSSVGTPNVGARMRLDSIFARNVGARYRSTPQSAHVTLAAADRTRGNAVLQSSWDIDIVKRIAKGTLGNKASSFAGSEPHRQLLWDSLVTALERFFVNKDSASEDIFDLVDVDKEVHPIYNDILLRSLVSLTTPHSPARRWVDASARISPRDGKRALLEIPKRLLPPGHRPLRHHEELSNISFGPSDDPEPLVTQFDECIKAIAASGAGARVDIFRGGDSARIGNLLRPHFGPRYLPGALDDKAAKRQLLAALDGEFYREVITPLRLDTELAKVAIEEIYNHVLEVWWCAHPNGPPTRPKVVPSHTPFAAAYAGGDRSDVQDFLDELARVVGEASALLASLRHEGHEGGRDPPPPRDELPRRHDAGGVRFPPSNGGVTTVTVALTVSFMDVTAGVPYCICPGHYHDAARCPTVCGSCDVDLRDAAMDMYLVVWAFQTAFNAENDEDFAELCQQHDRPLVRADPEPFTYPAEHDVGLRAHYAGLVHGPTDSGMGDVLADARGVLASLRSAAAAAEVGVAATVGTPAALRLGTLSVRQVVCAADVPPPANVDEIDTQPLRPLLPSDPAAYESPFEMTFMDRFHPACPDNPSLNGCSLDFARAHVHDVELSVIDDDTDSDISSCHGDVLPSAPPATSSRVGAAKLPKTLSFASLALPVLMCLACVSAAQGSVVLDRAADISATVHPTGVIANCLSDLPFAFPFSISFSSLVSAGQDFDFYISGFLDLLYASGFGFLFWALASGLWFGLHIFDMDHFFNSGELCSFVDHFESG